MGKFRLFITELWHLSMYKKWFLASSSFTTVQVSGQFEFTFVTRENHNFSTQNGPQSRLNFSCDMRGNQENHARVCAGISAFFLRVPRSVHQQKKEKETDV